MMAEEAGSVLGGSRHRVPPPLAPMSQTLRQILPYLQNGDLLMMRSESFPARFVQQVTGCQFCHIGVILRLPQLPYSPLLLEADPQVSHLADRTAASCLHVVDLRSRMLKWLSAAPGMNQAVIRRLKRPPNVAAPDASILLGLAATQQPTPLRAANTPSNAAADKRAHSSDRRIRIGGRIGGSNRNGACAIACCVTPRLPRPSCTHVAHPSHSLSCPPLATARALLEALYGPGLVQSIATLTGDEGLSPLHAAESVALAYKALGVLDSAAPAAEAYTVRDFSEHPPLREGYSLRTRIAVIAGTEAALTANRLAGLLGVQANLTKAPQAQRV